MRLKEVIKKEMDIRGDNANRISKQIKSVTIYQHRLSAWLKDKSNVSLTEQQIEALLDYYNLTIVKRYEL